MLVFLACSIIFGFVKILSIYDKLLETVQHLHPFFVHFGFDNIFEKNQLVESDSEIIPCDSDTSLALDNRNRLNVFFICIIAVYFSFATPFLSCIGVAQFRLGIHFNFFLVHLVLLFLWGGRHATIP